jgi:glucose-specific phosphotransferase system IIA component
MGNVDELFNPITGHVFCISDVKNHLFSQKKMGEGFAVKPDGNIVVSPVSGVVAMICGYAVVIQSYDGLQVLIHIGIDTVSLDGRPFIQLVKKGDAIVAGDPLVAVDWREIDTMGLDRTVIVAIMNTDSILNTMQISYGQCYAGMPIGRANIY